MTGADSGPVVAMEIFVEQNKITPMRILLELVRTTVHGTSAIRPAQKRMRETTGQLRRNIGEMTAPPGTGRILDGKRIAEIVMKLLERFDEQIIHGNQTGPRQLELPPKRRLWIPPLILHAMRRAHHRQDVGVFLVIAGQGPYPIRRQNRAHPANIATPSAVAGD